MDRVFAHEQALERHLAERLARIPGLTRYVQWPDERTPRIGVLTVNLDGWWFNVRKSNTEPLLRLNLEARDPAMLEEKFAELKKLLGEPVHGH